MPDKTPLELAHELRDADRYADIWGHAQAIAVALIDRTTPVEIGLSGKRHGYCPCGQNVATWYAFCVKCGTPLVWK